MASTPVSASVSDPAPSTAPTWRDVEPIDDGGPYVKPIDASHIGLVGEVVAETDKAWLVERPGAAPAWLPKSQCQSHGQDQHGRTILILPVWLSRKLGLAP
jgi:hypothetical protein